MKAPLAMCAGGSLTFGGVGCHPARAGAIRPDGKLPSGLADRDGWIKLTKDGEQIWLEVERR